MCHPFLFLTCLSLCFILFLLLRGGGGGLLIRSGFALAGTRFEPSCTGIFIYFTVSFRSVMVVIRFLSGEPVPD